MDVSVTQHQVVVKVTQYFVGHGKTVVDAVSNAVYYANTGQVEHKAVRENETGPKIVSHTVIR